MKKKDSAKAWRLKLPWPAGVKQGWLGGSQPCLREPKSVWRLSGKRGQMFPVMEPGEGQTSASASVAPGLPSSAVQDLTSLKMPMLSWIFDTALPPSPGSRLLKLTKRSLQHMCRAGSQYLCPWYNWGRCYFRRALRPRQLGLFTSPFIQYIQHIFIGDFLMPRTEHEAVNNPLSNQYPASSLSYPQLNRVLPFFPLALFRSPRFKGIKTFWWTSALAPHLPISSYPKPLPFLCHLSPTLVSAQLA